jgi:hypothetical protein
MLHIFSANSIKLVTKTTTLFWDGGSTSLNVGANSKAR